MYILNLNKGSCLQTVKNVFVSFNVLTISSLHVIMVVIDDCTTKERLRAI